MAARRRSADSDDFDEAVARELLGDLDDAAEQEQLRKADRVRARATAAQLAVIDDPSPRKATRCSRRAGKTTTAGLYCGDFFPRHPHEIGWYIAPTLKHARKLLWAPLRKLSRELSLGLDFHKTDATITWPNEGALWLAGADNEESLAAMLGHAPSLVFVDEAASFGLEHLVYLLDEVIEPSLMDNDGTLVLLSTPGNILAGRYYEITGPHGTLITSFEDGRRSMARPFGERRKAQWKGVSWEWSLHTWALKDNTARPDLWKKALALKKKKGWSDKNPVWRRQYLGEWTEADPRLRTFLYDEARDAWEPERNEHGFAVLPPGHVWRFLVGLDQGSSDPFAIQVAAYSLTSDLLLHCFEWETQRITVGELALKLNHIAEMCGGWENVEEVVSDHGQLGDVILGTLLEAHGIFVEPADKKNKLDHIELTNGELQDGRAKILKGSRLALEMGRLQNDPKRPGKTTGGANNNTDAYLYLAHRARDKNTGRVAADKTPAEKIAEQRQAEIDAFIAARKRNREPERPQLETTWETTSWDET